MRVLAIDPGFDRLGIAVIEGDPSRPTYIWSDCITPEKGPHENRLAHVSKTVTDAITTYQPDLLGIETLYFSVNKKSALGVSEARGTVLAAAGAAGLPVVECTPQQVKLAVTGYGSADKKSVGTMVPKLIALPEKRRLDDELDALAVGIAALTIGLPDR